MNKIPKVACAQYATAFNDILIGIVNDPTNLESLAVLFSFRPTILAKPRGGTNRNLANVVLKRLAGCNDNLLAIPDAKGKNACTNIQGQDAHLVAAVATN